MNKLAIICGLIALLPLGTSADVIFFKDGMRTICSGRAWEQGHEVKCEFDGMILSYLKKDVERVEKVPIERKQQPSPAEIKASPEAAVSTPAKAPEKEATVPRQQVLPEKNIAKTASKDNAVAAQSKGLEFYNPRRPNKYWISTTAKYQSFDKAIAALAKQYDRSPEWIKQHMGEINDLEEIHQNLASNKLNAPVEIQVEPAKKASETLFYNPRRPQKYWTGTSSKHKTFQQAISALANEYGRSQEWVQQYMGNSNNLKEIHQNLKNRKLAETTP